jgi:hypothetical protein
MTFTTAEKLMISLLCDLGRAAKDRELDYDFIATSVSDGDLWALEWKYPGLQLGIPTPPQVKLVCEILDMWSAMERSYSKLDATDKARVHDNSEVSGDVTFYGFDGNNEDEYHVARILVDKLDRWSEFKTRELNSHFPSMELHSRLLAEFRPIWDAKVKAHGLYDLSADELIAVVRERVHPEHREHRTDGSWAMRPTN